MLFGNGNIPKTLRELLNDGTHTCAAWHGCRYTYDLFILFCHCQQCFGEDRCSRLRATFLCRLSRFQIKRTDTMPVFFAAFSELIPFSFGRLGMNDHRFSKCFGDLHRCNQRFNIVSIYRSDILYPHLFKKDTRRDQLE